MTTLEMIDTLYDEYAQMLECAEYYGNKDNELFNPRKARDFEMRACEAYDIALTLFKTDLLERWLDAREYMRDELD